MRPTKSTAVSERAAVFAGLREEAGSGSSASRRYPGHSRYRRQCAGPPRAHRPMRAGRCASAAALVPRRPGEGPDEGDAPALCRRMACAGGGGAGRGRRSGAPPERGAGTGASVQWQEPRLVFEKHQLSLAAFRARAWWTAASKRGAGGASATLNVSSSIRLRAASRQSSGSEPFSPLPLYPRP